MLNGHVAFVTGGAGGIGGEICRRLAAAGHRVAVADLAGSKSAEVAREISGVALDLDVTDAASVRRAADAAAAKLGPVDMFMQALGHP